MKKTLTVVVLLGFAATAGAQVVVHERSEKAAKEQQLQVLMEKTAGTAVHVSVEPKRVVGAPYSAEAVTESVQVLADGNRIVRRSASRVYRDGKGRTRREELGPDGQVSSIAISDPASGTSVVFDPAANVAHRIGVATFISEADVAGGTTSKKAITLTISPDAKAHAELKAAQEAELKALQHADQAAAAAHAELKAAQEAELKALQHADQAAAAHAGTKPHVTGEATTISSVGPVTWVAAGSAGTTSPATKEDLGEQVVEGVTAKGTRTTTVIPAGAIGNEQPITVTSEEWFSPDLKVLVMTKHADPRSGETTYRLTDITRGEPDASLFELPAGVTIR
jgi:hypothetical protein